MPTIFLIDGSSQMYRAYHAIRGLTGPDGRSTNAVYGFVTMLRKLIADHKPEYIVASFDLAGPTFRDAMVNDYKANRAPMPSDLAEQIPWVHEACEAMGVPILVKEGFEADDVIGTVAEKAAAAGFQVVVVTGDKDLLQLVRDGIKVFNPRDEGTWYDAAAVKERFGVPPERVVDVLALTGDAIDNVKGVPGIGEKGARELIGAHGSLEALLANAASVPQKKYREALIAHAADARQSLELVRLRRDVPVEFDPASLRYSGPSRERCYELFSRLGFRSLVRDYAPSADSVVKQYTLVETPESLRELRARLEAVGRFGLRVVASEPSSMRASTVGFAFSTEPRRAWYVPVGHVGLQSGSQLTAEQVLAELRPVLEDPRVTKVGHDLKFDRVMLRRHGVALDGLDFDTMIASYLLDATRSGHPLEEAALEHLDYKALTEENVCGRGAKAMSLADLPAEAVLDYACERADLALQLAGLLAPALASEGLEPLYREMEMPLVPVLADMELAGVRVDARALAQLSSRLDQELAALHRQIVDAAGVDFNINSPRQLSEVLFDKLQLPSLKKTGKTKTASTAVEVLEELALTHELPRLVLEWRTLAKLKGTYVDALPQLLHPQTGRVHTCFNQAVAATGRLSSSDPNLQNIPIRTELGREIRKAFVAPPGSVLISADYSQIELRVLAHMSGDSALTEAFRRGEDIHDRTALAVFGRETTIPKHELRRRAKMINYALLYGKTAFSLAKDIGVTQQAAQQFIDAYFAGFPSVAKFIDETLEEARRTGVVKTLFGRRRPVPEITSRNGQVRSAAERVAVNMPIQGTAADILKRAMIAVAEALSARSGAGSPGAARMILTVHDELLFEAPESEADEVAALVRHHMERAATLSVPLTVDVGIGANWKDAKG
ncbi:MAG: DNA polymerase I [Vicinamibacterales bacterium]